MNELIRIESYPWFEVLKGYIDKGFTKHISPDYFYDALDTLNNVDQVQFTQMVSSLWNSYKMKNYLLWLNTINEFSYILKYIRPIYGTKFLLFTKKRTLH